MESYKGYSYVWFHLLNNIFVRFICIVACSCINSKFTLIGLYSILQNSFACSTVDTGLFPVLGYYKQCCYKDITFIKKKLSFLEKGFTMRPLDN